MESQTADFLTGYHRSPQLDQPRHIEILAEKNTLLQLLRPLVREFYVPVTFGRGYGSFPIWRDIARRFMASGKTQMTLMGLSDFDPEGLDLPHDAIRSLRLLGVDPDYHRVAVTRDQIDQLGLAADFNPATKSSSRFKSFVRETGSRETWELEALDPHFLQQEVRLAIESSMDSAIYQASQDRVREKQRQVRALREQVSAQIRL